jgi:hypothetical protein
MERSTSSLHGTNGQVSTGESLLPFILACVEVRLHGEPPD